MTSFIPVPSNPQTEAGDSPGILETLMLQREQRIAPGALVRSSLNKAHASQAWLHAFTCVDRSWQEADVQDGPLAGIPIGVKDLMATADMVTTNGSAIYADQVPATDAWVVSRLRSLGAVVAGKTVTTEFAWRQPGSTRNPWNLAHTPGGSSSGSAAAVAAGIVPAALGTQTFGSVIRPAAFCGVVGMKPSYGAVARTGVHPLSGSLDHVGVFARSVSDAGYLLSWMLGTDAGDPHGMPVPAFSVSPESGVIPCDRPRLALMHTAFFDRASVEQQQLLALSAAKLQDAGAVVETLELPAEFDGIWTDTMTLLAAEAAVIYGPLCELHGDRISTHIHQLVAHGRSLNAPTYLLAQKRQRWLRAALDNVLQNYDAVLTLPAAGEAPHGLADTGDAVFCTPWSFLGVPAIALPAGLSGNGLPLGVQLVATYRNDLQLLRVARWCELALGYAQRCPQRY